MSEMMKRFIDKEVLIDVINNESTIQGIVKEVDEKWLVLDTRYNELFGGKDSIETLNMINIEYITRIREYPRKANGKKKNLFA